MAQRFVGRRQEELFGAVLSGLRGLGYRNDLIKESYAFEDWFSTTGEASKLETADAVAFGREPVSDESACIAVAVSNGRTGAELIGRYRSLGAPLAFEVGADRVRLWSVRADWRTMVTPEVIEQVNLQTAFDEHQADWSPSAILRAKNIGPSREKGRQFDFVDAGLLPALEGHIRDKLDPLLRRTFFAALETDKTRRVTDPDPSKLFRLVFRVLAGKVLTDRREPAFLQFEESPDPDELLRAVNVHFGDSPKLLADAPTRKMVVERLWGAFSLRHISAAALSLVWENTLVDEEVRKTLGLHGTPASVAKYVVEQTRLEDVPERERFIVEPCCGSGVFLLAAVKKLTSLLEPGQHNPTQRHDYLRRMVSGFDIDPFGREVAVDCLMLADYPNSNHWVVEEEDVFEPAERSPSFHGHLQRARFVFCNPPFTPNFTPAERRRYRASSIHKPAELVKMVLAGAPSLVGVGLVMPHTVLMGAAYRDVRQLLAKRFEAIEVVSLPERGVFSAAEYEVVLVIARRPGVGHTALDLTHRVVTQSDWPDFAATQQVSRKRKETVPVSSAADSIAVTDLSAVWSLLSAYPTVGDATNREVRRGVRWNKSLQHHRAELIAPSSRPGFAAGVVPAARSQSFQYRGPRRVYLSTKPEDRDRNAFDLPWDQPKVLMNAHRRSRSPWRIACFPDRTGLLATHKFLGVWPVAGWAPEVLAAVLNGPVANAYLVEHASGRDVPTGVVESIPAPRLSRVAMRRVAALVAEYQSISGGNQLSPTQLARAKELLLAIDAEVLDGYSLPPPSERAILNGFRRQRRPLPFPFPDYVERLIVRRLDQQLAILSEDADKQPAEWEEIRTQLDLARSAGRRLFP